MKDIVHRTIDVGKLGDVVMDETKAGIPDEMCDIRRVAGDEIVDADDPVPFLKQSVTQVRTEESRSPCDDGDSIRSGRHASPCRYRNRQILSPPTWWDRTHSGRRR